VKRHRLAEVALDPATGVGDLSRLPPLPDPRAERQERADALVAGEQRVDRVAAVAAGPLTDPDDRHPGSMT
jgi:hypothetical protein